jgi:hypothetical protein
LHFPKLNGGKGEDGEIKLINGDNPRVIMRVPERLRVESERRGEEPKKRLAKEKLKTQEGKRWV